MSSMDCGFVFLSLIIVNSIGYVYLKFLIEFSSIHCFILDGLVDVFVNSLHVCS